MENKKEYWENLFKNKNANELSWTQKYPTITMQFINEITAEWNLSSFSIHTP